MKALVCSGLTRRFAERTAVDDLSFELASATVFGFLGPNGAGKTTTVRMLAALIAPTAGSAQVLGYDVVREAREVRARVGVLTETPSLYDRLTARENLIFFGRLYGLSVAAARSQAERYLRLFDLWPRRDDAVGAFSKGMRQKVALARALLHDPQLVFLDEPTAGLDPEAAFTLREFIRSLRTQGRTVFLTTHNLSEADSLCDLIAVFRGRLLRLASPAELRRSLYGEVLRIELAVDAARFAATVEAHPAVRSTAVDGRQLTLQLQGITAATPELVSALVAAGAPLLAVEPLVASLEQVYLELVNAGGATA
jgi:ABC-2 type transport system ATP-binding protein